MITLLKIAKQAAIKSNDHIRKSILQLIPQTKEWNYELIQALTNLDSAEYFQKIIETPHTLLSFTELLQQDKSSNIMKLLRDAKNKEKKSAVHGLLELCHALSQHKKVPSLPSGSEILSYYSDLFTWDRRFDEHTDFLHDCLSLNIPRNDDDRDALQAFIRVLENQLSNGDSKKVDQALFKPRSNLILTLHKTRQAWNGKLDLSFFCSDENNRNWNIDSDYYYLILENLNDHDRQTSFPRRQNIFLDTRYWNPLFVSIELQQQDITEFLNVKPQQIKRFLVRLICTSEPIETARQKALTILDQLLSFAYPLDPSFYSVIFFTLSRLKTIANEKDQPKLFSEACQKMMIQWLLKKLDETPPDHLANNTQKTLIFGLLAPSSSLLEILLNNPRSSAAINLQKPLTWCFDENENLVSKWVLEHSNSAVTIIALLQTMPNIKDQLNKIVAIQSLHINDEQTFNQHPFLELIKKDINFCIDCLKQCRHNNPETFNQKLLSELVLLAYWQKETRLHQLEYLIGDTKTGADTQHTIQIDSNSLYQGLKPHPESTYRLLTLIIHRLRSISLYSSCNRKT
ncbi:MAG TPA: hypothetical protein QF353_02610 [Gammaproteobacteria bacterium]|nr:hypothetical protein [Gammaproteobacteria bacterium]